MKKLTILLLAILIIGIIYFYPKLTKNEKPNNVSQTSINNESTKNVSDNCASAGQFHSNPSLGPANEPVPCCDGLISISSASKDSYENMGGQYIPPSGSGLICSDCGNGKCEQWEHQYNCPSDCRPKQPGNKNDFSSTSPTKTNLEFTEGVCSVNSEQNIGEIKTSWTSGTLIIKTYIQKLCQGEEIIDYGYEISGDNIFLTYTSQLNNIATGCFCVTELTYQISDLTTKNYSIKIIKR